MSGPEPDECEHGASGYCGLCLAVGENKLSEEEAMRIHLESKSSGARFAGDESDGWFDD